MTTKPDGEKGKLTEAQLGILRDVAANKVSLDDCGEWLRDQLVEIIFIGGEPMIDTQGPSVFITESGRKALEQR